MEKFNEIKEALRATKREGIENLISYLEASDFKTCPASARYHNNFEGGLLDHTYNVWKCAEELSRWPGKTKEIGESYLIAAVCHDLSKIGSYKKSKRNRKDKFGNWESYEVYENEENPQGSLLAAPALPLGHSYASIEIAERYIKLTDVEKIMIANHMGAIGVGYQQMQEVSDAFRKCPEACILHLADMQASYILEKVKEA